MGTQGTDPKPTDTLQLTRPVNKSQKGGRRGKRELKTLTERRKWGGNKSKQESCGWHFITANSVTCSAAKSKSDHALKFWPPCQRKQKSLLDCSWVSPSPPVLPFAPGTAECFQCQSQRTLFHGTTCQALLFPAISLLVFLQPVKVTGILLLTCTNWDTTQTFIPLQTLPWNPAPFVSHHLPKLHSLRRLTTASRSHT